MVEIDNRKAALIAELEISRGEMRKAVRDCEESLDLVSHVRRSVGANLKYWLPGAALGGWILSKLVNASLSSGGNRSREATSRPGPGRTATSAGWILAVAKIGFELLRPQLADIASEWVARKAAGSPAARGQKRTGKSGAGTNGASQESTVP